MSLDAIQQKWDAAIDSAREFLNPLDPNGNPDAAKNTYRYPSDLGTGSMPYIQFKVNKTFYWAENKTTKIPKKTPTTIYSGQTVRTKTSDGNDLTDHQLRQTPGDYICLYMPIGIQISDNVKYDIQSRSGLVRAVLGAALGDDSITGTDLQVALQNFGKKIASGVGLEGAYNDVVKMTGKTTNPREFVSFQAPSIREFSFSFKFVPTSAKDALTIHRIIKSFRSAMYPKEEGAISYIHPYSFLIKFQNVSKHYLKLPECVLTSCSLNYNPTSSSFYEDDKFSSEEIFKKSGLENISEYKNVFSSKSASANNIPAEIDMNLSFQEIEPIDRNLIEMGY